MIKRHFFIMAVFMTLLSGCGLKGGLYLPDESGDEKTAEQGTSSEEYSLNPASSGSPADETSETDRK